MILFDAHLDLAWNAIDWNRNLLESVQSIRLLETSGEKTDFKSRGRGTVSFPALRQGKVGLFIATLLPRLFRPSTMPALQRYSHMQAAQAASIGQMEYYRVLESEGHLNWIRDRESLQTQVSAWEQFDQGGSAEPKLSFILSMEGADPILKPEDVEWWYQQGLRIVGPAHYGVSPYAHGTATIGGLFPQGPKLLKEMERVGMILDVTHLSDQCFDEAMDIYSGPVLASHHNCRALVPDQRQLTDEQIKRLIERGAVIGAAFDAWMLAPGWIRGQSTPEAMGVSIETVVNHIDHICQLAGNAKHAGIGSDLDGGFGREQSPHDLDTIADLQRIPEILSKRGYTTEDIKAISYGNWVGFFDRAWS
jgi:membrane dipeptidase